MIYYQLREIWYQVYSSYNRKNRDIITDEVMALHYALLKLAYLSNDKNGTL